MALTDPELDLLRELLEDDPTDGAFLQVGEELVRRGLWGEAAAVLSAGLAAHAEELAGWSLLARAAFENGQGGLALTALQKVDTDPARSSRDAQLLILALERAGRTEEASERVEAYLAVDPDDVVIGAARERLHAPPPAAARRGSDPFLTVARAERYVAMGRKDRAVRVYRRIVFHHPGDDALRVRLGQLSADDAGWSRDDLSDDLGDPSAIPPILAMPSPRLATRSDEAEPDAEAHTSAAPAPRAPSMASVEGRREDPWMSMAPSRDGWADPDVPTDPDDEDADPHATTPDGAVARVAEMARRRRRTLIQR